jgi:DNA processing protein
MLHLKFHALEAVSRNYAPLLEGVLKDYPELDANAVAVLLWGHIPKLGLKRQKQLFQSFSGELLWQLFWVPPQWGAEHFGESFKSFPSTLLKAWEEKQVYFKEHLRTVLTHYQTQGVGWMGCHDDRFPERLAQIHESPAILFFQGNIELLQSGHPFLSVVGTRHASDYACEQLMRILEEAVPLKPCIVSGLAMGIDAVAHQTAINNQIPTIAVLAGGLDYVTPPCNEYLGRAILDANGLLISEMPLGVPPIPKSFPRRNRLIVGLSPALWVVEGSLLSGTMVSARIALEESRDVGVLPMDITRDGAAGPLKLLKEGAMPISCGQDLADLLGIVGAEKLVSTMKVLSEEKRTDLLESIQRKSSIPKVIEDKSNKDLSKKSEETELPQENVDESDIEDLLEDDNLLLSILRQSKAKELHVDSMALLSGMKPHDVLGELSILEITGRVERRSGNIFTLVL